MLIVAEPNWKVRTFADWESLDKQLFQAEKIEKSLGHRFRGMKNCPQAPPPNSFIGTVFESAMDRLTAAVGMSDSFEAQFQTEVGRISLGLEAGKIAMPDVTEMASIMAHSNVDQLHLKHVH